MKKILIASIVTFSMSVKAQTEVGYDNIFFTNLYPNIVYGNASEQPNYHISNTSFGGAPGLDVKWWGGVKLRSAAGLLFIQESGNVGVSTESPREKLEVVGNIALSAFNYQTNKADGKWILHTRGDGPNLYLAPRNTDDNGWDWTKQTVFRDGNISVSGKLEAKEIKVTQSPTADFVFEEDYPLPTLEAVEQHIKEKKHLPEIASAKEMDKEGVNVGEFQIKLLQKQNRLLGIE